MDSEGERQCLRDQEGLLLSHDPGLAAGAEVDVFLVKNLGLQKPIEGIRDALLDGGWRAVDAAGAVGVTAIAVVIVTIVVAVVVVGVTIVAAIGAPRERRVAAGDDFAAAQHIHANVQVRLVLLSRVGTRRFVQPIRPPANPRLVFAPTPIQS